MSEGRFPAWAHRRVVRKAAAKTLYDGLQHFAAFYEHVRRFLHLTYNPPPKVKPQIVLAKAFKGIPGRFKGI